MVPTPAQGVSFLPQKGLMNSPYLLAEVLETVELFTALYAVTCLDTKATTEPSGTYRGKAGKGLGTEALPPSQDECSPWGQSGPHREPGDGGGCQFSFDETGQI